MSQLKQTGALVREDLARARYMLPPLLPSVKEDGVALVSL